jgi:threonine/homoserine/homoserine lactone efflux protein
MTATAFLAVVLAHLAGAISPGPTFVVAARAGAAEGFRTAAALALGFALGAMVWALAAILGLAALFEMAPALLLATKVAGAAFLVWIGWKMWRHAAEPLPAVADAPPRGLVSAVRFGLLTQLSNPKIVVYFGAVIAGLVPHGATTGSLALLVAVIGLNEWLWYAFVGRVFALDGPRAAYIRAKTWVDRGFGGLVAAFGIKIAAS